MGAAGVQEMELGEAQYELLLQHVHVYTDLISYLNNHKLFSNIITCLLALSFNSSWSDKLIGWTTPHQAIPGKLSCLEI